MPLTADNYAPQLTAPSYARRAWMYWALAAGFGLFLVGIILGAPLLAASGHSFGATTLYKAFSPLCHQIDARSFHFHGHPFAVCARCTGIYFGFTAGALLYPIFKSLRRTDSPPRIWLILATVPTTIDFLFGFTGVWSNTHWSRFLTASILGATAAVYIVPGLMDLALRGWRGNKLPALLEASATQSVTPADTPPVVFHSDYSAPLRRI